MTEYISEPLEDAALVELDDNEDPSPKDGPWGHINEHAFAFRSEGTIEVERESNDGGFVLSANAPILHGLPVLDEREAKGDVIARTMEERIAARNKNKFDHIRPVMPADQLDGFRPRRLPIAYFPRTLTVGKRTRGPSARGGHVTLSDSVIYTTEGEAHSTIINGESRSPLYPGDFPYTAVCKLELWNLSADRRSWINTRSYGSGFLVGRQILLTSGHAFKDVRLSDNTAAIRVIPACWANSPVYGLGLITWVRRRRWWHSDSGNDLQICQVADPIGDQMGYFGVRVYDDDWEGRARWTMAGFPYDRSQFGMSVQRGITVRDDDDGDDIRLEGETYDSTQIESDADEASGASGSPLFGWFGKDNPCAIGVHSGYQADWTLTGTEHFSCAAGGDALKAIVRWGRRTWD